ncbi:MAG: tripartite tricarboxylate transporter TctB family protein [Thermodesulfobacteriota bacterium]
MRETFARLLKNSENWILSILGAFGVVFIVQTYGYRPSAALFPRLVGIVVVFLSFYQLGENVWLTVAGRGGKAEESEKRTQGLRWHWSFLLILLYFGLICLIGFVWGTGLFLMFFPFAAGYKRWLVTLIVAVVTAILIEVSFSLFLQIPLPSGILLAIFD